MESENIWQSWQEPTRNESVSVGLTQISVAPQRNKENQRKAIIIRNNSPNAADIITLNIGTGAATSGAGIILRQYESWSDSSETGYDCVQNAITAICATATGVLAIYER